MHDKNLVIISSVFM